MCQGQPALRRQFTKEVRLWDKTGAIFKLLEFLKAMPPPVTNITQNVQVNFDKALAILRAACHGGEHKRAPMTD